MRIISFLSDFIVPMTIFYVVVYGLLAKVNIYDEFMKGAQDGFKTVMNIIPTILGLMVAVGVLRASGTLELMAEGLTPIGQSLGIPLEIIPLFFIRLFSASAANGLVFDLFKEYGPDSSLGLMSSIMMSCTETVFYTMSVYFAAVKITKTRYTLAGCLISSVSGVVASIILTYSMM